MNGKLIAAETRLDKLRDKEIGSSQSALQKALMSNFFAAKRFVQACTTEASTSTMEAATSRARCRLHGGAGEGTAKRPDLPPSRPEPARSDHRGNGRARTHARTHAREMKHVKRWRNCQRRTSIGLNRSAEGPHAHLRTRQSADINLDDEEHGSLSSV
jgi:hypothetical protein